MKRLATLWGLLLVVCVHPADAADQKKKKKPQPEKGPDLALLFNQLDKNNDKKVDKNEFNAFNGLNAGPKKIKQPKKKQVVLLDTVNAKPKAKKKKKPATPANSDIAKKRAAWFKQLDTNSDNVLTLEEFSKIKSVVAGEAPTSKKKAK